MKKMSMQFCLMISTMNISIKSYFVISLSEREGVF